MQDFRNLTVWEKAHLLTVDVYHATQCFPTEERYGLQSQIRRCASSIPSNLAEGCGRDTNRDFARYCQIAMGSASELEYQLFLAAELGILRREYHAPLTKQVVEVKKMLAALIKSLHRREH